MANKKEVFPLDEVTLSVVESSLYVMMADEQDENGDPVSTDGGITLTGRRRARKPRP